MMRKLIFILALFSPLPVFAQFGYSSASNYSSGNNGITATFPDAGGKAAVVEYYQNNVAAPVITLCGGTVTAYQVLGANAFGQDVTLGVANNLPSGCTTATGSNTTVGANSIIVLLFSGAQASLPLENYTGLQNPNSHNSTFAMSGQATEGSSEILLLGFDYIGGHPLTESMAGVVPGGFLTGTETGGGIYTPTNTSMYSWYGPVSAGTYINTLGGMAASVGPSFGGIQFMIFLRSTLPHLGVVQFSHTNPTGSGTSTTCALPFPVISGDLVYAMAVPNGSSDVVAIPTDSASNTYVPIASEIPSASSIGGIFYATNVTPGTFPLTVTFATQGGASATVFDCEVGEIHGAASLKPYAGSVQEIQLNFPNTAYFKFGPLALPTGNYVMVGAGQSSLQCEDTMTGGYRLGQCINDTNGLTGAYISNFSSGSPLNMQINWGSPGSSIPYSWTGMVISDTDQPDGLVVQTADCPYSCISTSGTLKTNFNVTAGNTGVVWFNNNSSTVAPTISDSLLNTWTPFCTFVANAPYYGWYATNMHGGAKDVISFTNLGQTAPVFVELSQVNASGFDGSACNGGTTAGGSGTTYNSGPVTTSKTDLILSLGSFTHGFGDSPVSQTDACNAPVISLYSDYSGSQISACYSQAPGTYTSADYWSTASGQVGAAILAFNNSTQPGNGVTAIKAQAKIHGKAVVK